MNKLRLLFFICINIFWLVANLYSQNQYVFFGSFSRDKAAEGLHVYELDSISGRLRKLTSISGHSNPSYLTLSPDGKYVYVCTETKTPGAGSVSSFAFDAKSKTLRFINSQKSFGENPVYLTVHKNGKWLVVANYTEGSVAVFPLAANGAIDSVIQYVQYLEGSINTQRQERGHIHAAVFSLDFDYIFFTDLGADKIRSYQFDSSANQPLKAAAVPFTKTVLGSGPRHFTFHPNGKFAYCIEELSGTVSVFKYEAGKLDSLQRIEAHNKSYQAGFESSDIHISPDARFLYASNRGAENNLAIYAISEDGTLKTIDYQPTFGKHPRTFAIDESGRFLIVTHVSSGNVTVFRRDIKTGLLKRIRQELNINNVSSVKIRRY